MPKKRPIQKTECEIEKRTAICRFSLALEKPKAILGELKMLVPSVNANRRDRPQPLLSYSNDALSNDLIRVHEAWRKSRRQHDRFSVYQYLTAVFDLVAVWEKENRAVDRAKRTLWLKGRAGRDKIEPFAAVIKCTSPRKKVDAKARSKWAHALMFAAEYKLPDEPLEHFIRRHGGINSCAAELSRLGRSKTWTR
jgi:hypothetical protein